MFCRELSPRERSQSHSEAVNTPSIDQDHSSYSKRETQSAGNICILNNRTTSLIQVASIFTPEIKSTEPNSVSETSYNNDQVSNTCRFWFEVRRFLYDFHLINTSHPRSMIKRRKLKTCSGLGSLRQGVLYHLLLYLLLLNYQMM